MTDMDRDEFVAQRSRVKRLRRGVDTNEPPDKTDKLMTEAADEIERLRAALLDVDRLTDERGGYPDPSDALRAIKRMVRRALLTGREPNPT